MDPLVIKSMQEANNLVKKPVLCMLEVLSTIIRGGEQSDQESATHEKIALAI